MPIDISVKSPLLVRMVSLGWASFMGSIASAAQQGRDLSSTHSPTIRNFRRFQKTSSCFGALDGVCARAFDSPGAPASRARIAKGQFLLDAPGKTAAYGVRFLFFVISGFLICTLFLRGKNRSMGKIDLWRFYGRRMLQTSAALFCGPAVAGCAGVRPSSIHTGESRIVS